MAVIPGKDKQQAYCTVGKRDCNIVNTCDKDKARYKTNYCDLQKEFDELKKSINHSQTNMKLSGGLDYSKLEKNLVFNPIVFFSQNERPDETQFSETIKDAKKFYFTARTGITFLGKYSQRIKKAIDTGCDCKFIIINLKSQAIKYGQFEAGFDQNAAETASFYLRELKLYGKDKVKIHVIDHYPTFDFEYFEKTDGKKIIIIQTHFLLSHLGPDRPMFMLKEGDYWYQTFLDEFEQLWEKSQEWGEKKRIVIDGAPGSGKTSLLTGMSQRDESMKKFVCLKAAGYTVFNDLIISIIDQMRKKDIKDPSDDWNMFFELAIDRAIDFYESAETDLINFYDRGIFYLEILSKRYGCELPKRYFDFCEKNRYDDPIFVLNPILSIDMTKPHKTDNMHKVYSIEDRLLQHQQIVELYKKYGYEVVEIPLFGNDLNESTQQRLAKIKEKLRI